MTMPVAYVETGFKFVGYLVPKRPTRSTRVLGLLPGDLPVLGTPPPVRDLEHMILSINTKLPKAHASMQA